MPEPDGLQALGITSIEPGEPFVRTREDLEKLLTAYARLPNKEYDRNTWRDLAIGLKYEVNACLGADAWPLFRAKSLEWAPEGEHKQELRYFWSSLGCDGLVTGRKALWEYEKYRKDHGNGHDPDGLADGPLPLHLQEIVDGIMEQLAGHLPSQGDLAIAGGRPGELALQIEAERRAKASRDAASITLCIKQLAARPWFRPETWTEEDRVHLIVLGLEEPQRWLTQACWINRAKLIRASVVSHGAGAVTYSVKGLPETRCNPLRRAQELEQVFAGPPLVGGVIKPTKANPDGFGSMDFLRFLAVGGVAEVQDVRALVGIREAYPTIDGISYANTWLFEKLLIWRQAAEILAAKAWRPASVELFQAVLDSLAGEDAGTLCDVLSLALKSYWAGNDPQHPRPGYAILLCGPPKSGKSTLIELAKQWAGPGYSFQLQHGGEVSRFDIANVADAMVIELPEIGTDRFGAPQLTRALQMLLPTQGRNIQVRIERKGIQARMGAMVGALVMGTTNEPGALWAPREQRRGLVVGTADMRLSPERETLAKAFHAAVHNDPGFPPEIMAFLLDREIQDKSINTYDAPRTVLRSMIYQEQAPGMLGCLLAALRDPDGPFAGTPDGPFEMSRIVGEVQRHGGRDASVRAVANALRADGFNSFGLRVRCPMDGTPRRITFTLWVRGALAETWKRNSYNLSKGVSGQVVPMLSASVGGQALLRGLVSPDLRVVYGLAAPKVPTGPEDLEDGGLAEWLDNVG